MKKNLHSFVLSLVLLLSSFSVSADDKVKAEEYVRKSLATIENFSYDPNMGWFRANISAAKGILIIPAKLEAAFMLGGAGGTGVLLKHNKGGNWSSPAFYGSGDVSFGFQAGVQAVEVVMLIMTEKGMDALLSTKVQLGADVSVAIGPIGAGAAVATTDILQFSRNQGVFGGFAAEGAVISPFSTLNNAYYGQEISPVDILVRNKGINTQADDLRAKLQEFPRSGVGVNTQSDNFSTELQELPVSEMGVNTQADAPSIKLQELPMPEVRISTSADELPASSQNFSEYGLLFAFNSAKINSNVQSTLDYVVTILHSNPGMTMEIEGYTDDTDNTENNQDLAKRRVQSAKGYLVAQGIEPTRLAVKNFGFASPVSSDFTEGELVNKHQVILKVTNK